MSEWVRLTNIGNLLIGGTTDITGSGGLKVFGTTDRTFGTFGTGSFSTLGGASITKSLQVGFDSADTFTVAAYGTGGSSILGIGGGAAAKVQAFLSGSATSLQLNPLGGAVSVGTTATVVTLNGTTASTSTTTGALTVAGGVGVAGAAFFGGAIAIGNTVNTVTATLPNRTITMVIGGTTYYIHAKTTND
jgi:hypothetical protein